MVFSSYTFIFVFLPLLLMCYFLVRGRARNYILLIFSMLFYAWGEPVWITVMVLSAIVDYTNGRIIEKYHGKPITKVSFLLSIIINLGLLSTFKYGAFFVENINAILGVSIPVPEVTLPIGISFYTFQTMSYSIDVYRGNCKAQHSFLDFMLFVSLFPQLIAGPIVRYVDIADQLDNREHSVALFSSGLKRFIIGFAKKIILADTFGSIADQAFGSTALTSGFAWIGVTAYAFQILFDFSGYSDMAIGLGRMFGFKFLENFNYPYISASITEFWRRWHISLSTWFRDYVYIPLGGNRVNLPRQIFNLLIVWLLTGFWHGASWNFLLWGVYYGLLLIIEKFLLGGILKKIPKPIRHFGTLLLVLIGWALFKAETLPAAFSYLKTMFAFDFSGISGHQFMRYLLNYRTYWLLAVVACTPLVASLNEKLHAKLSGHKVATVAYGFGEYAVFIALFALTAAYLTSASYNAFIYFRF